MRPGGVAAPLRTDEAVILVSLPYTGKASLSCPHTCVPRERGDAMSAPLKPDIVYDDFDKLDIRVGLIERVEDVEGSKKLVALTVDFGGFRRTILSGMREGREDPGALVGTKTLFLVNMAPRKMAGRISEGMLLDIGYEDGIVPVLPVLERDVPAGTRLC